MTDSCAGIPVLCPVLIQDGAPREKKQECDEEAAGLKAWAVCAGCDRLCELISGELQYSDTEVECDIREQVWRKC
jgi:hypothetical protein